MATIRANNFRGWVLNGEDSQAFGIHDLKGREVGAAVKCYTATNTPHDREYGPHYSQSDLDRLAAKLLPAGFVYGYVPQATRAGKAYGAAQDIRFFASREGRDADVRRYFAEAAKRATKLAGK